MVEALIKDMVMKFAPSGSPDVVGYKMYLEKAPNLVNRGSFGIYLGMPPIDPKDGLMWINIADLSDIPTTDGTYNIGVVAIDDRGNESSFTKADDVPLDFVAPDAPGELKFVDTIPT